MSSIKDPSSHRRYLILVDDANDDDNDDDDILQYVYLFAIDTHTHTCINAHINTKIMYNKILKCFATLKLFVLL